MRFKNTELYNIEELIQADGEVKLCRIPDSLRLKLNEGAQNSAFFTCGSEIRFNMISDEVVLLLRRPVAEDIAKYGIAEVYYGSFPSPYWASPVFVENGVTEITVKKPKNPEQLQQLSREKGLPFDPELIRVILPYDYSTYIVDIRGETAPPRPEQSPRRKYLSYGSSITHGGSAIKPTGGYAMRTARMLGADLINLGFAGSAFLEAEIADYIAARTDWNFASLELGANVVGRWSTEEFASRVDYFISTIVDAHPDQWIFCMDMFPFEMDSITKDPKAGQFREIVRCKVERVGREKVVYANAKSMITSVTGVSADLLHPSEEGFEEISRRLSAIMKEKMAL